MQVNYDFYENLTPMKFDRIIEELDAGDHPAPEPVTAGALHPRDPAETRSSAAASASGIRTRSMSICSTTATKRWKKR